MLLQIGVLISNLRSNQLFWTQYNFSCCLCTCVQVPTCQTGCFLSSWRPFLLELNQTQNRTCHNSHLAYFFPLIITAWDLPHPVFMPDTSLITYFLFEIQSHVLLLRLWHKVITYALQHFHNTTRSHNCSPKGHGGVVGVEFCRRVWEACVNEEREEEASTLPVWAASGGGRRQPCPPEPASGWRPRGGHGPPAPCSPASQTSMGPLQIPPTPASWTLLQGRKTTHTHTQIT